MLQDKGPGEENPGEIRGPQVAPAINQSSQTLISFSPFIFFQLTSLPKHYHRLSPSSLQSISLRKHYRISPSSFRSISLPKHYNLFPSNYPGHQSGAVTATYFTQSYFTCTAVDVQ